MEAAHELAVDRVHEAAARSARVPACAGPARVAPAAVRRRRGGAGPSPSRASSRGRGSTQSAAPRSTSPSRCQHRRRNRVGDATLPATPQRLLDPAGHLPRGDLRLLALRIDRHDPAGAVADEVDDRVRHLQTAPVRVGLAEQRDLQALLQLAFPPRLVEEHDVHAARPVADRDVDHRSPIPRHPLGHRSHRDQDERLLTGHEIGDARLVRPIDPPARIRRHQVEDGVDADRGERRLLLVTDALQPFDGDVGELAQRDRIHRRHRPDPVLAHSIPNRYGYRGCPPYCTSRATEP